LRGEIIERGQNQGERKSLKMFNHVARVAGA